jgi:hypothetical protein
MKLLATSLLLLAGLVSASAVFAVDFTKKGPISGPIPTFKVTTVYACDNTNLNSGFFQDDFTAYGNNFNFAANSNVDAVEFIHYGFGFPGPYNYDLEFWDKTSCTKITSFDGLVAGDAGSSPRVEHIDACFAQLNLTGEVIVAVDPNTCLAPNDCYPDVIFDTATVQNPCPYQVNVNGAGCFSLAPDGSGAFLLRVEVNNCPTPVHNGSWGAVKQIYR